MEIITRKGKKRAVCMIPKNIKLVNQSNSLELNIIHANNFHIIPIFVKNNNKIKTPRQLYSYTCLCQCMSYQLIFHPKKTKTNLNNEPEHTMIVFF